MNSGIYRLYWLNCKYYYFGQSGNLTRRKNDHIASLVRGAHRNKKIQDVYDKYGTPVFEILELCPIDQLDEKEQLLINAHFGNKLCCNYRPDVKTMRGYQHTDETKLRLRNAMSGRFVSQETRIRHSIAYKKRADGGYIQPFSDGTRKKMSDAR
ncbi:MAG TPA: GIY-YIG nuclease family protein [Cyclobacteriaceae bacterium]|nr:GIY-YIG nuclease family protein [Cyclobacteriaceae bacterium]